MLLCLGFMWMLVIYTQVLYRQSHFPRLRHLKDLIFEFFSRFILVCMYVCVCMNVCTYVCSLIRCQRSELDLRKQEFTSDLSCWMWM